MKEFLELQKEIAVLNSEIHEDPWYSWFSLVEWNGLLKILYYGEGYDDDPDSDPGGVDKEDNYPFLALLELIAANSDVIHSIDFRGPDMGANGVRSWDFQRLVNKRCVFSNMRSFNVELTDPGFHNISVISSNGDSFSEGGTISNLISRMPVLEELVVPSAPNEEFFEYWHSTNLRKLRIESGFQSERFIKNYSECKRAPKLLSFDFSDVSFLSDPNEIKQLATSVEDYDALFSSAAFRSVNHVTLRNTQLQDSEYGVLASRYRGLQILVVSSPHGMYLKRG